MFIEIIGRRELPGDVDTASVEDLIAGVLGDRGEVAGTLAAVWGFELDVPGDHGDIVPELAGALVEADLGWVLIRVEDEDEGTAAEDLI